MLCPTCPKRNTCKSACAELEKELARIEVPLREILKAPNKLQKLSDSVSAAEFYRNSFSWEDQYESEAEEKAIVSRNQLIQESLLELTPRQRECVCLYYWDGLTYSQIAEKLGISRQTIEEHLEAAYTKIRKYLTESLKTPCISELYK